MRGFEPTKTTFEQGSLFYIFDSDDEAERIKQKFYNKSVELNISKFLHTIKILRAEANKIINEKRLQ